MKEIAVVICNYNKKDYILKCIDSLLKSTYKNLDIYIVDNASTDGSAEAIRENYKKLITLIVNDQNLGGSGGFNTGLKEILNRDYKYAMLLDNDVILDKNTIFSLYNLLEDNDSIAVAGSKIYSMDNPNQIQELGAEIDFSEFYIKPFCKGYIDDGAFAEVHDCDYVPACSMMVRVDAIRKVGIMDEGYFIYWDDIDWGYRFKLAGYRVVTDPKSLVWHKMGVAQKTNTFGTYYFWRNRIHFFIKYCSVEEVQKFTLKLFDEIFQSMYSCNYIGKYSSARTILIAVSDALNNIRGKALDNRIMEIEKIKDKFADVVKDKNNIIVINNSEFKILRDVINKIKAVNESTNITILTESISDLNNQFNEFNILSLNSLKNLSEYDLIFKTCYHIFDERDDIENGIVYVDRFFNTIACRKDIEYVENYDNTYTMLKNIWYPVFLSKMLEYKQGLKN